MRYRKVHIFTTCRLSALGVLKPRRAVAEGGQRHTALPGRRRAGDRPGLRPGAGASSGGGGGAKDDLANHWKQWDAKPEAGVRFSALRSFGCDPANRWKRRDAKPEAKGRRHPLYARSVALWQTIGNGGTQNLRLRGESFTLCSFGHRISLRPSKYLQRKEYCHEDNKKSQKYLQACARYAHRSDDEL